MANGANRSKDAVQATAIVISCIAFLVALAGFYVLMNGYYTVEANEQAVVLRFGKYLETSPPGLHFCIPLVDSVTKVSVEEHSMRLPIGSPGESSSSISEDDTLVLTGDLNAAAVEWTIQWKVDNPTDFLFSFNLGDRGQTMEDVVGTAAQTVMNRLIGDYSIDEVLTEKREEISSKAREATQEILDHFHCGVSITDLQLQRVTPPEKVKPAFAAVNSAVQQRDKLENEANKERNTLLPAARAERDKRIRDAQGYADRRRAEVDGEISALRARYQAYAKAPEVTRQRLYLEAMLKALSNISDKTIIDSDLQQLLPLLQLNEGAK
ncbi:FtsH protease activity modulator HflK [Planctomicrobium piriforme]|uniref:Protein HflK n=1 Tax=Planctomicrobium piriforme TaxID=1576369 RepID=A0A1I3JZZ8_9PLAN|nr:FtsH protease activity modulator HflK [Planctomicrobium piriforme]SFI65756.1 membrane protease subunit HflK [Planctomicrobium piriforme]